MAKRISSAVPVTVRPSAPLDHEPKRLRTTTTTIARPAADIDLSGNDDREQAEPFGPPLPGPRLQLGAGVADRLSCLAAPYAAHDTRTARYFELAISKAKAPVVCASAGQIKGKAIYADRDIEQAARIWTEAPFVALQHEQNRGHLRCCQYCFVPLLSDYHARWREMAARWNRSRAREIAEGRELPVRDDELDLALQQLKVHRKNCGLGEPVAICSCGEVYCSKLCQLRAYHESHSILCPRDDPYSSMSQFSRTRDTNDIFLLVAKVIARVLSRFLNSRDVVKAREPVDMFYKKPWWEVVMMEKQLQHLGGDSAAECMDDEAFTFESRHQHRVDDEGDHHHRSVQQPAFQQHARARAASPEALSANLDEMYQEVNDEDGDDRIHAHGLRELLTYTHELLVDAIESNLVHLEREHQLHGLSVDSIWTSCASVLSFEFFVAQLGLFEMNNVSMEIDHPFRGLIEIFDPDVHAETNDPVVGDGDAVVTRVRRVLAHEESLLVAQQQQQQQGCGSTSNSGGGSTHGYPHHGGFAGVEGTALFPIICTMNHSCAPNCTVLYTKDGHAHVVAVRDIKKGDELCICYIDIDGDVQTREKNLREYKFKCFCSRCSEERRALGIRSSEADLVATSKSAHRMKTTNSAVR